MPGTTPALAPGGARRARHPLHGIVATAVTILTVAGCHDPLANPGEAEAARTHLDAVLNQMELHSLRRRDIDWTQLRATVTAQASDPADLSDVFPAIETALAMLGDGRSSYVAPSEWGYPTFKAPSGCTGPQAQTLIAPPDIGYVRDSSFDDPAGLAAVWAGLIYIDLLRADSRDPAGWIVDLRGNASNTSMWPGVLGVGPLLGEGTVAWFVNADGGESRLELLSRNLVLDGQTVLTPITGAFPLEHSDRPVAVLIDGRVSGWGEGIAAAFKGRPNTRFFGTATCGHATATLAIGIDGAVLNIAHASIADRDHTLFPGPIAPDETIADVSQMLARAVEWLRGG